MILKATALIHTLLLIITTALSIHINCGGQSIGDGIVADNGFATTEKSPYSNGPFGSVYNSHAWRKDMNELAYSVPANANARHIVRLQFAEIYRGNARKGARIIDVYVNGIKIASDLDVFHVAGGLSKPHDEIVNNVIAPDGKIIIKIVPSAMNAFISGIEVTDDVASTTIRPSILPTSTPAISIYAAPSESLSSASTPVESASASFVPSVPSATSTLPRESILPSPSTSSVIAIPSTDPSTSTRPNSVSTPSPRPLKLTVTFTRVSENYPLKVFEAQGTVLGQGNEKYLTVIGGFYKFPGVTGTVYQRKFGLASAPWVRLTDMPNVPPVTHMAQWASGNKFCGAGGFIGRDPGMSGKMVWCFDRLTNSWSSLPDLPEDRAGGGLAKLPGDGEKLIYAGGVDRTMNNHDEHIDYGTTWILDLNKPNATWQDSGEKMPNPRNHMAAIETCGRILFVGGQEKINEHSGNMAHIDEWLVKEGRWSTNPPRDLPLPLGHISASVMAYKCGVTVVGGITQERTLSDKILWWDPITDMWNEIGKYPNKVATPVCGIHNDQLMCATAGNNAVQNQVFIGNLTWN